MLVLSRKLDESIIVVSPSGEIMEIKITKIEENRTKVGIEAPSSFKIFRKEVFDSINME